MRKRLKKKLLKKITKEWFLIPGVGYGIVISNPLSIPMEVSIVRYI